MWQRKALMLLVGVLLSVGLYLSMPSFTPTMHAQTKSEIIKYGQTVHDVVEDRFGDEWLFFGWADEVITITFSSSEFDTYLELYGPQYRRWYRRNNNFEGMGTNSALNHYTLPLSGYYTIVAASNDSKATGTYTLSLNAPITSTVSQSNVVTATVSQSNSMTPTVTQENSGTQRSPDEPSCTVISSVLNLRSGPSVENNPPLDSLARSSRFWPNSRNEAGTWIEITAEGSLDRGWVRASTNFIDCMDDLMTLPISSMVATPATAP